MKNIFNKLAVALAILLLPQLKAQASSHREAPLIAFDPLADNTDLYAFRSPCDTNKIVLIANYIPFEHPAGGPNYYTFGENIRYEIHVKNNANTPGDNIVYRFTFQHTNQDATTFFNIRLGQQNIKTTYTCERSMDGGNTFSTIVSNGVVPPPNIGPRSIENATVGLGATSYGSLMQQAVATATSGEKVFCGPADDPFFVDLGGAFDVGGFRTGAQARDGLAKFNCHTIAIEVPITTLQKNGMNTTQASSILDGNFVIGVWASASRPQITTLSAAGNEPSYSGNWVQVSRLGMPLTNEVVIPLGMKDQWNRSNPYTSDGGYRQYFQNPELALYMDNSQYGGAVPGLDSLRIQTASLGTYDFRNTKQGLYPLKNTAAVSGTALADIGGFGAYLLPNNNSPRAVDIMPIFLMGVPNLNPYQLATGKNGNPLAAGKPFINNFLLYTPLIGTPEFADLLRLNMAVPVTPRTDPNFSSLGIVKAAVLGLTDPTYNNTNIQFIPNMDGFPNGRRLEDDVTTIELQAVSGVALAAIGLWYDDYTTNPVTPDLLHVIDFNAGVTHNDTTFQQCFPYLQEPWRGFNGQDYVGPTSVAELGLATPAAAMNAYPNPFTNEVTLKYKLSANANIMIQVVDLNGRVIQTIANERKEAGEYSAHWNSGNLASGIYFAKLSVGGQTIQSVKLIKTN
ncbi:MAG: DUF4331 family protein [Bacteroidetes bacterium]|nr:DUF4331 family protein [Bacteroidota bacterium]